MDVAVCVVILVACVTTATLALLAMQAYLEHCRTVGRMRSTQASLEMVFKLVNTGLQVVTVEMRRARAQQEQQQEWRAQRAQREQQEQHMQEPPPHPVRAAPRPPAAEAWQEEHYRAAAREREFRAFMQPRPRRGSDGSDGSDATAEALEEANMSDDARSAVPAAA